MSSNQIPPLKHPEYYVDIFSGDAYVINWISNRPVSDIFGKKYGFKTLWIRVNKFIWEIVASDKKRENLRFLFTSTISIITLILVIIFHV